MNFAIGLIGANITLGLISGISATANSIFNLISNIKERTTNGVNEIKQMIQKSDLENKIKITQFFLCELSGRCVDRSSRDSLFRASSSLSPQVPRRSRLDQLRARRAPVRRRASPAASTGVSGLHRDRQDRARARG